jgi:hypothetical protein
MNDNGDAFDMWTTWAKNPLGPVPFFSAIHSAVMALPPEERRDRERVNEAVRNCLGLGSLRRNNL